MFFVPIIGDREGYWHLFVLFELSIRNGYQPSKIQHKYRIPHKIHRNNRFNSWKPEHAIDTQTFAFIWFLSNVCFRFGIFSYFILKYWNNCLSNEIRYWKTMYICSSKINDSIAVNYCFLIEFLHNREQHDTGDFSPFFHSVTVRILAIAESKCFDRKCNFDRWPLGIHI